MVKAGKSTHTANISPSTVMTGEEKVIFLPNVCFMKLSGYIKGAASVLPL